MQTTVEENELRAVYYQCGCGFRVEPWDGELVLEHIIWHYLRRIQFSELGIIAD